MQDDSLDLTLPDGRTLEVRVSGPADGVPLVWHHGTPGCAYQSAAKQRAVADLGLRLVSYSRAGAGRSTRRPGRSVADVAGDIEAVLDHLGADRCLVGGQSGGGPHALATAAALGDRVAAVICACGVRPYDGGAGFLDGMGEDNLEEFGLALEGEGALRPFVERHAAGIRAADARGVIDQLASLLPPADRAVLSDQVGVDLLANLKGGAERIDAWVDDDLAFTRPWGFDLADVRVPTYVWQGTEDLMVPAAHATYLAERLPHPHLRLEQGEGHLSIVVGQWGRMVAEAATHL